MDLYLASQTCLPSHLPLYLVHSEEGLAPSPFTTLDPFFKVFMPSALGVSLLLTTLQHFCFFRIFWGRPLETHSHVSNVSNQRNFLSKSNIFRALDGIADAAAFSAMLSILSAIYPENISAIMAVSQGLFGVGYTLGIWLPFMANWLFSSTWTGFTNWLQVQQ